jgi:hypothetical protein
MARVPELDQFAMRELPDGRRFDEAVHIVHVYTLEAHPALPDMTPYSMWTDGNDMPDGSGNSYGDVGQAYTWSERRAQAHRVLNGMENEPLMLIDALPPDPITNPVWCTYATAPNPAFVIDQDGTIVLSQLWSEMSAIERAVTDLVTGD